MSHLLICLKTGEMTFPQYYIDMVDWLLHGFKCIKVLGICVIMILTAVVSSRNLILCTLRITRETVRWNSCMWFLPSVSCRQPYSIVSYTHWIDHWCLNELILINSSSQSPNLFVFTLKYHQSNKCWLHVKSIDLRESHGRHYRHGLVNQTVWFITVRLMNMSSYSHVYLH